MPRGHCACAKERGDELEGGGENEFVGRLLPAAAQAQSPNAHHTAKKCKVSFFKQKQKTNRLTSAILIGSQKYHPCTIALSFNADKEVFQFLL
jgi:hypothetical protein